MIEIDRSLDSKHRKHGFVYEVNYGFVPGVIASDGECLDAYVLRLSEPVNAFEGECIAVIHRFNDDDDRSSCEAKDRGLNKIRNYSPCGWAV